MEKLDLRAQSSRAKSIGTVVSITGALIVTLYKGLPITRALSTNKLLELPLEMSQSNWAVGGFFLAAHSVILALFYIIQVQFVNIFKTTVPGILPANCKLLTILFFISEYLDMDHQRIPCRDDGNTHLLRLCNHIVCNSLPGSRKEPKCLETKSRYGVDSNWLFGKQG